MTEHESPQEPQNASNPDDAAETLFAELRAKRLGGDDAAQPSTEAAGEAPEPGPEAQAKADSGTPKPESLTPNPDSGNNDLEELRRQLRLVAQERDAAVGRLQPIQRKLASYERNAVPAPARQSPAATPAVGLTDDLTRNWASSADVKKALSDFPEVKPIVDGFQRVVGVLEQRLLKAEEANRALAQNLDADVLPRVHSLANDWESQRFEAKVADLNSAFPDWPKHYAVRGIASVDEETGERITVPVDGPMSPQFAGWLFAQPPEIAELRFSPDPAEVKRMWAKFAQDTTSAPAASTAMPQARTQRLAASVTPQVRTTATAVQSSVRWEDMSPEEQFVYLRKQRKQQAGSA